MRNITLEPAAAAPPGLGPLSFRAREVTGTQEISVTDVPRGTPASAVAQTVAARMELPTHVPWALRSDRTGAWLRDEVPIEAQIGEDPEILLTLTPKAHLGGGAG